MPPLTTVGQYLLAAAAPGQPCHPIVCGRGLSTLQSRTRALKNRMAQRAPKGVFADGKEEAKRFPGSEKSPSPRSQKCPSSETC